MSRKLPNLTKVLPASSKAKPWKVERHTDRREHVTVGSRLLYSRETFEVFVVGRYKHQWQADKAALRSAMRHGGFAVDCAGQTWPRTPIKPKKRKAAP